MTTESIFIQGHDGKLALKPTDPEARLAALERRIAALEQRIANAPDELVDRIASELSAALRIDRG